MHCSSHARSRGEAQGQIAIPKFLEWQRKGGLLGIEVETVDGGEIERLQPLGEKPGIITNFRRFSGRKKIVSGIIAK